jgi:hypothetical protein
MNEHEFLGKLAGAARRDRPPDVNVVAAVLGSIATARPKAVDPVLGYFALVAGVAATVVLTLAIQSWLSMQDPLMALGNSFNTVTL